MDIYKKSHKHGYWKHSNSNKLGSSHLKEDVLNKFEKQSNGSVLINESFKIFEKKIILEKNKWKVSACHDGYQKKYGTIHKREIEYSFDINTLIGKDTLLKKKKILNLLISK